MTNQSLDPLSKIGQNLKVYAKYSSLAFQMLAIVLAGVFGGMWADRQIPWKFPVFTTVLSIASVVFAIYYAVKDFIKRPKDE